MHPSHPYIQKFPFTWEYQCIPWRRFSTKTSTQATVTIHDRRFPPPYLQTPPRLFPLATTSNRFKTMLPLGSPPPALWGSSLFGLNLARILSKRFATKSCLRASQHFPRPLPSNFYDASPPRGVREKKTPMSFSRPLPPFFTLPPPSPPPQQLLGPATVVTGEYNMDSPVPPDQLADPPAQSTT